MRHSANYLSPCRAHRLSPFAGPAGPASPPRGRLRPLLLLLLPPALLLLFVSAPLPVAAGGFTIPLVGSRMSGQAAFAAQPDDSSAVYHNPAGLVLVPQMLRLDLSSTGILTNTAYRRADYPQQTKDGQGTGVFDTSKPPSGDCPAEGAAEGYDGQGYVVQPCYREEVTPESRWGTIPFAGLAYRSRFADLAFGLGLYSPHNATAAFPADGAQRYFVTEGSITTVYLTPSLAWRPHPVIALGAGMSHITASARYKKAFWLGQMLGAANMNKEMTLDLDAEGSALGWDVGLILFPGELLPALAGLQLGASYTSRAELEFEGELAVRGASTFLGGVFETGYEEGQTIRRGATASFAVPDTVRVGLGYAFGSQAWVGADVYWSNYSLYDKLTIELDRPLGTMEEFEEKKDSADCWSLALGGRYSPLPSLDLRLGLFLDQSPYPDEYYAILSPDADKLGATAGVSWRPGWGFELSFSYMALFYQDRVVTTSKVRPQIDTGPPLAIQEQAPFSGNGEVVDKLVHVFGAQLAWGWGS